MWDTVFDKIGLPLLKKRIKVDTNVGCYIFK